MQHHWQLPGHPMKLLQRLVDYVTLSTPSLSFPFLFSVSVSISPSYFSPFLSHSLSLPPLPPCIVCGYPYDFIVAVQLCACACAWVRLYVGRGMFPCMGSFSHIEHTFDEDCIEYASQPSRTQLSTSPNSAAAEAQNMRCTPTGGITS